MYDALTARYRFRCLAGDRQADVSVPLSAFRHVRRLPGPAHPAVFRVTYACARCGDDHDVLVTHDDLDYAPLEPRQRDAFWDPLTGRIGGDLAGELLEAAWARLRRGVWPMSFWCSAEDQLRPGYPSALSWVLGERRLVGIAVSCATCDEMSLNLVSQRHLDEPFYHDRTIGTLARPVGEIDEIERFRRALWSATFDERRTDLAA